MRGKKHRQEWRQAWKPEGKEEGKEERKEEGGEEKSKSGSKRASKNVKRAGHLLRCFDGLLRCDAVTPARRRVPALLSVGG